MVKYVNREITKVNSEIVKVNNEIAKENPSINKNKNFVESIVKYILRNGSKFDLIEDLYFSDHVGGTTANTSKFRTNGNNGGDFYFLLCNRAYR